MGPYQNVNSKYECIVLVMVLVCLIVSSDVLISCSIESVAFLQTQQFWLQIILGVAVWSLCVVAT